MAAHSDTGIQIQASQSNDPYYVTSFLDLLLYCMWEGLEIPVDTFGWQVSGKEDCRPLQGKSTTIFWSSKGAAKV